MTADIELLPLPDEVMDEMDGFRRAARVSVSDALSLHNAIRDYARAVAEHNVRFLTHELANAECAIDAEQAGRKKAEAEIEALRAEVGRLTSCLATANANHETFERRWYLERDRAERLAEALRRQRDWWLASKGEAVSNAPGGLTRIDPGFIALCDAHVQQIDLALRDHDQEGKDG